MSTFQVFLSTNFGAQISYSSFVFSGGELSVKLEKPQMARFNDRCDIVGNIESANDIIELMLLVDALRRAASPLKLSIRAEFPYFPYARQDRVMVPGEALSVKVMADLINSLNFESIVIWDAHSDVTPALLNNCINKPQDFSYGKRVGQSLFFTHYQTLVAPDAGAMKKAQKIAQQYNMHLIHAEKTRDVNTGAITGTKVHDLDTMSREVKNPSFLIVDDICDGGRTFIELGKEIRNVYPEARIGLYVTHGIFSKGLEVFEGVIDQVYCPNVFRNVGDHPLLTRLV